MYNIKFAILSGSEWHWVLSHWGTTITAIRSWNFFIFPNSKFFPRHSNSLFPALINSVLLAACLDWAPPPLPGIMPLPFVLDVFCSVQCLQGSPRLQQASEFPSFLRLINTPVCGWATFCLPIHPSVDTGVVSTFRLLWLMLPWTWICKYLFKSLLSILLVTCPEMDLLDCMVTLFDFSRNCRIVFHSSCTIYKLSTPCLYFPHVTV